MNAAQVFSAVDAGRAAAATNREAREAHIEPHTTAQLAANWS